LDATSTLSEDGVVAGCALAYIVSDSTARRCDSRCQARQSTSWDLRNKIGNLIRRDSSGQDGNEGSFGELHFGGSGNWFEGTSVNEDFFGEELFAGG
jgi:hypothetical protein